MGVQCPYFTRPTLGPHVNSSSGERKVMDIKSLTLLIQVHHEVVCDRISWPDAGDVGGDGEREAQDLPDRNCGRRFGKGSRKKVRPLKRGGGGNKGRTTKENELELSCHIETFFSLKIAENGF